MARGAKKESSFDSMPLGGKLFILVILLGVLGAVYYFAFHMGLADQLEQADTRYGQLQASMREAQSRQQQYLELSQQVANREGIDRENKRVLPEHAEIASFLQDLNRTAELSGLDIRRVEPQAEEAESLYVRIPVSLSVRGRFHQLAKFFHNISGLERAISMENIHLVRQQESGENESSDSGVILEVDMLATTYRRPSEGAAAAGQENAQ
ncbi:MAG: type 4a pilus biogenesis protein PilO [Deltaproteobacteria bacterium]|nr:type 4a pilus biogenesis protein PilO [Deltaproteobacteria bacterium]